MWHLDGIASPLVKDWRVQWILVSIGCVVVAWLVGRQKWELGLLERRRRRDCWAEEQLAEVIVLFSLALPRLLLLLLLLWFFTTLARGAIPRRNSKATDHNQHQKQEHHHNPCEAATRGPAHLFSAFVVAVFCVGAAGVWRLVLLSSRSRNQFFHGSMLC